jgi:Rieske Fe-S protein
MPATFVREVPLPFPVAGAVRFEDQARFHPTAYLAGLARRITEAGMRIYEGTRVVNVHDGEPCRVETDHGTVLADRVLFATHTPAGFTLLHAELEPLRSYVLAVRLRGQEPPDGLFFDTAEPYNYTRKQPTERGDLLIVGGQDHKVGDEGEPPASYYKLEEYVRQHWDVESIEHRWSAQLYDPPDGLPLIGESLTSSRVFLATGYSGTGMVFGTLGGMLLADLALGRGNPWAGLYRPSRIRPLTAIPEIAKLNVQAAAAFVKDRIETPRVRDLSEIPAGQGKVVQMEGERMAVYRDESGAVHAVSPVCTHAQCIVHWNSSEKTWDCPCHGSRFGIDGKVIEGPAVKDLEPARVRVP